MRCLGFSTVRLRKVCELKQIRNEDLNYLINKCVFYVKWNHKLLSGYYKWNFNDFFLPFDSIAVPFSKQILKHFASHAMYNCNRKPQRSYCPPTNRILKRVTIFFCIPGTEERYRITIYVLESPSMLMSPINFFIIFLKYCLLNLWKKNPLFFRVGDKSCLALILYG